MQMEVKDQPRYAVVAAVQLPNVTDLEFRSLTGRAGELAKTLGLQVVHTFIQKRTSFDTTAYLGVGKRQEIQTYVT
jgi:GTP-binding protein HflX